MKIFKPSFWNKKNNIYSIFLIPFAVIFQLVTKLRKKFVNAKKFNIPVICVGNIYLGGTGKTPLSILIANELRKDKKKPVIIRKLYKNHKDEHELIRHKSEKLIIKSNRKFALEEAERENFNVAILDDGFQDHSIKKNLNILCFNSNQLIGNGLTLPSGPLRESIKSVERAKIIVINGEKNEEFEKKILDISNSVSIYYSKYLPSNIESLNNKQFFAFAGIGNPDNFFQTLKENKIDIKKKLAFPDHYNFNRVEIQKMVDFATKSNLNLITTEKDYFRIKHYEFKNINYLKINLEIFKKDRFIKEIKDYL